MCDAESENVVSHILTIRTVLMCAVRLDIKSSIGLPLRRTNNIRNASQVIVEFDCYAALCRWWNASDPMLVAYSGGNVFCATNIRLKLSDLPYNLAINNNQLVYGYGYIYTICSLLCDDDNIF